MTITCKYSCSLCGLERVELDVPIREPGQNVTEWMERVCIPATIADHHRRSPNCHPTELKNLMIPIGHADYIGGPSVQ